MKYVFMSDVLLGGGPKSRVRNMKRMLQRHAEFEYEVYTNGFERFFKNPYCDILHVHCSRRLLQKAISTNIPLMAGPNIVWEKMPRSIIQSKNVRAVLLNHRDPAVNPSFLDRVYQFPAIIDEDFFAPSDRQKEYDVLTVGKSFIYPGYEMNLSRLHALLKSSKLTFHHLTRYKPEDLSSSLNKSKIVLFPSPKEASGSYCHFLLEVSMSNVPFVALRSLASEKEELSRGTFVDDVEQMIPAALDQIKKKPQPRNWAISHSSYKAGYSRLKKILKNILPSTKN